MAEQKSELYAEDFAASTADPATNHRQAFDCIRDADFLHQMLYLDSKIFMTSLNLTYNDKMSMASSVEVRVPFLDRELAEFVAWNVPPSLKLKGRIPSHDEIHISASHAWHSSRRSLAATESGIRRSSRLLAGA